MKILYRNNDDSDFGRRALPLEQILAFEIFSLDNGSMLDGIEERWAPRFSEEGRGALQALRALQDRDGSWEEALSPFKVLVGEIGRIEGRELRYGLWLADRETVEDHYDGVYDGDERNMTAVPASDVCICDLGGDGMLFAYDVDPYSLPLPDGEDEAPSPR